MHDKLARARKRLRMTQQQIAAALEIPEHTWHCWERGTMRIQHPRILELALKQLRKEAK